MLAIPLLCLACPYWLDFADAQRNLVVAAADDSPSEIRHYVSLGADVNKIDPSFHDTALGVAALDGSYAAARELIRLGARARQRIGVGRGCPMDETKDPKMLAILATAVDAKK